MVMNKSSTNQPVEAIEIEKAKSDQSGIILGLIGALLQMYDEELIYV